MSVKVRIENFGIAMVTDGRWSAHPVTKVVLTGFDSERLFDEVGYHPFPDLGIAEMAISELGGDIIEVTDAPEYVAGRVY